jgi:hypothetical protein
MKSDILKKSDILQQQGNSIKSADTLQTRVLDEKEEKDLFEEKGLNLKITTRILDGLGLDRQTW